MRERNYGICLLRCLFTFQVAMGHSGGGSYFYWIGTAVPFFMLTSFYLTAPMFHSLDRSKIKRRIFRICVPYFGYGFISFIVISLFNLLNGKSIVPVKDLLWQLSLGSSFVLDPPLWFLFDLIICSIIIFLVSTYIIHKKLMLFILIIGSFCLQYTEINFLLFSSLPSESKWSLGRLIEMLPYACGGILLAESNILQKYTGNILFFFFITLLLLFFNSHGFSRPQGFIYQDISTFIHSLLIFPIFYLANLEKLNTVLKRSILYLSEYSLGIYCIHFIILNIANKSDITLFSNTSVMRGILIYLLSLYISILIGKIPSKMALSLVK